MNKILLIFLLITQNIVSQTITIKHTAYEIEFDTILRQPISVHYILCKENLIIKTADRTEFKQDTLISQNLQGSNKDYSKSSNYYDRGHLAPNNDFRYNKNVQYDSMLYTNCVPQNKELNRGIWKALENYVRDKVEEFGVVEVWTGCIYNVDYQPKVGKLSVPEKFYKIIKYNGIIEGWQIDNIKPNKKVSFKRIKK